jgi:hypothetical protein
MTTAADVIAAFDTPTRSNSLAWLAKKAGCAFPIRGPLKTIYVFPDGSWIATTGRGKSYRFWEEEPGLGNERR